MVKSSDCRKNLGEGRGKSSAWKEFTRKKNKSNWDNLREHFEDTVKELRKGRR